MNVSLITSALIFSDINTRIGWPWTYWEHGLLPFIGFLAVCVLLLFLLGFFCSLAEEFEPALVLIVMLLLVIGLLLQALPPTTTGIQFIPLPPWYYTGWIAWIISGACWFLIALACFCVLIAASEDKSAAGSALLLALLVNALLSFATPVGVTPEERPTPNQSDTIAKWEKLRSERSETLTKLSSDKDDLVARIRSVGARNKKELMDNPLGRTLVDEYEQLCQQMATLKREVDALNLAIERAESRQRMAERKANGTKLTEKERDDLSELDHQLELRHAPGHEVQLDKLLDEVLK